MFPEKINNKCILTQNGQVTPPEDVCLHVRALCSGLARKHYILKQMATEQCDVSHGPNEFRKGTRSTRKPSGRAEGMNTFVEQEV
uniref:Uncharacterized protein n=1 Tax=Ixodes ricinus TaxID=34613 RepID=A0A6B0U951_IXORI